MKYPKKKGMLKYVVVILAVVFVYLVVTKIDEGFQTGTTVDLYFGNDNPAKGPNFIGSSDPRVKYVSSAVASANVSIDPSLGTLKSFSGAGWSDAGKWIPVVGAKLDNAINALNIKQPQASGTRLLRNPTYAKPMLAATKEVKLPQQVGAITLGGLDTATFALGKKPGGSPANGNAKILVRLTFQIDLFVLV